MEMRIWKVEHGRSYILKSHMHEMRPLRRGGLARWKMRQIRPQAQMQSSFQVQQMDMVAEQSSLDVQMEEQVPWDGLTVPVAGDDGSRLSQIAGLFF